jgi:hypothetical protein
MKKQKLFSSAKGCTKLYKNKDLNIIKNLSEDGKRQIYKAVEECAGVSLHPKNQSTLIRSEMTYI